MTERNEDPELLAKTTEFGEALAKALQGQPYVLVIETPNGFIDVIANVNDDKHARQLMIVGLDHILNPVSYLGDLK